MITGKIGDLALAHLQQLRNEHVTHAAEYWALTLAVDLIIGLPEQGVMEDIRRLCESCKPL